MIKLRSDPCTEIINSICEEAFHYFIRSFILIMTSSDHSNRIEKLTKETSWENITADKK